MHFTLLGAMLDLDEVPDKNFDWNSSPRNRAIKFAVSNGSYDQKVIENVDELHVLDTSAARGSRRNG